MDCRRSRTFCCCGEATERLSVALSKDPHLWQAWLWLSRTCKMSYLSHCTNANGHLALCLSLSLMTSRDILLKALSLTSERISWCNSLELQLCPAAEISRQSSRRMGVSQNNPSNLEAFGGIWRHLTAASFGCPACSKQRVSIDS